MLFKQENIKFCFSYFQDCLLFLGQEFAQYKTFVTNRHN
ncbi:hypothetical protein SAMD00020551_1676 [Mesobacillus selenatarsenatis SF-1]|uniref:Uncharacterized protein n=1 Tax=Mesobacillus selenatarsenatis (strain DSM 18680 / JCM 14380 / FERM P-15431 / SF-1) TaxID=1321606 RepID=A0A0A8X5W4_MESS1|nr:hypothetical protein SAMD00020551_1676 [Mesobacillus selenatarsenatis SF-1]